MWVEPASPPASTYRGLADTVSTASEFSRGARPTIEELDGLLTRVGTGDHAAFEALYLATRPRITAIALRVLRNPAIASEAVQECYLDVWRLSATFDPARGTAIGWISTIAHRRSVDMVRRAEASFRREVAHGIATYCPAHQDEPAAAAIARAELTEVVEALSQLSSLQRQAVQMVYFSGLPAPEIALKLGVPLATLRTRLRDGVLRLRKTLVVA
jgi:RNA polymerase sigma-70 factor (ECF subfamily)